MKQLVHLEGDKVISRIPLRKSKYTLGRGMENDIVFDIGKVSRQHAILLEIDDSYYIIDKNSLNHVYVNGEQVKRKKLESGDKINLSTELTLLFLNENTADEKVSDVINKIWDVVNKKDFLRLREVTNKIISLDSLPNILKVVLNELIELINAERGFIALIDENKNVLFNSSVTYNLEFNEENRQQFTFSHSVVQRVVSTGESIFILNTKEDSYGDISRTAREFDLRSVMCTPLLFGNKLIGVIYVDSSYVTDFTELDQFFFTILSDHAAIAIKNAGLYEELNKYNVELKKEIIESGERYRNLVELSPDAILVHCDGKIVFVNAEGVKTLGAKTPEDILGKNVLSFVVPEYREIVQDRIKKTLVDKVPAPLIEEKLFKINGEVFDAEVAASPFTYKGKPAVQIVARDITRRKNAEKEMHKASKLESIGTLAGGIAHDFNNILTVILGNISLVKMTSGEDKVRQRLTAAENACVRAREISQQLLTFSEGGKPLKTNLAADKMIRETINFALSGSNVSPRLHVKEAIWDINADENQLRQAFSHIIINAKQAMPEGGIIDITLENCNIDTSIAHIKEGKYLKISIKDYGTGISNDIKSKVFDPYFTTRGDSSGLGLTTAYSIISRHKGYITFESGLEGTTFEIYLPALTEKVSETFETEDEEDTAQGKGKILIMDDDDSIRKTIGEMLKQLGYSYEEAASGQEVIERYQESLSSGELFDAVIMDLTIPGGMGGKEAIQELLKLDPKVKALVSSGYSNSEILAEFESFGFKGVVKKPYKITALNKMLKKVLK